MSDHLVVIPAFDEAPTLGAIVTEARRSGSVLVVDDGSTDGTSAVAGAAGADVIRLDRRHGKGEALRRGFREGLARGVDRVVTLDGDGQHDPTEIARLLKAAAEAPDALIIGGRLGEAGARLMPAGRLAALRVAGFFIDWLTGVFIADTQSGFRVYPAGLLRQVSPRHGGFVLETEMLIRAAAAGWRIVEVPIGTTRAPGRRSRFRAVRDGVEVGAYLAASHSSALEPGGGGRRGGAGATVHVGPAPSPASRARGVRGVATRRRPGSMGVGRRALHAQLHPDPGPSVVGGSARAKLADGRGRDRGHTGPARARGRPWGDERERTRARLLRDR